MKYSARDLNFFSLHSDLIAAAKKRFPAFKPCRDPDADGNHLLFLSGDSDRMSAHEMLVEIRKLGGLKPKRKPAPVKWKKDLEVQIAVTIGGITTYDDGVVKRVNKKGVYLDNGDGNDDSGPFDLKTGRHIPIDEMGLGGQVISPKEA